MKLLVYLLLLVSITSCSLFGEDKVENTPAKIDILFPAEAASYYQGLMPNYVVFNTTDSEKNIKKLFLSAANKQEFNISSLDLYDDKPDTLFNTISIFGLNNDENKELIISTEETDEGTTVENPSDPRRFKLIPDVPSISNPSITVTNIAPTSPTDEVVTAQVQFNLNTESKQLSTIHTIRFSRFPNQVTYEPSHFIAGGDLFDCNSCPVLNSNTYNSEVSTPREKNKVAPLYAVIYVKGVQESTMNAKPYVFL